MNITVYAFNGGKEYKAEFDVRPKEAPEFLALYEVGENEAEVLVTENSDVAKQLVGGATVFSDLEDTAYEIAADREYDAYEEAQLQKAEWERDD